MYQHSLVQYLYQLSLPSAPIVNKYTNTALLLLLQLSAVPAQPPNCSCNTFLYLHSLPSVYLVIYCTIQPPKCYIVPAQPSMLSCSTLLYQHSLPNNPVILYCTNSGSPVLLQYSIVPVQPPESSQYSAVPTQPSQLSYSTLLYRQSLSSAPIVFRCTSTASRVLHQYSSVPAQPPEYSYSTLLYQHSLTSALIVLRCTSTASRMPVADPEGVRGVQTNPLFSLNYFIFMGNFMKNWSNCTLS